MNVASKQSDRLPTKRLRQLGLALALSAMTFGADAAGLGRLNLMSALGQPLRAEIELTSVARDEAGALTAKLAGADAFNQAGIEYGSALSGLRFSIQRRQNGTQYVLVTSSAQVNEPFLDLLVELTWGSGRLVREYTVLHDPPETRTAQRAEAAAPIVQAQSPVAPTVVRRQPRPEPVPAEPTSEAAPVRRAPAASRPAAATADGDYTVQSGDTALGIARANKPDDVSLEQMLAVLYRDNQRAFSGNVNRLMAGATLRIPDAATAKAIDGGEARRVIAQSSNFAGYRERVARDAAPAASARTPSSQAAGTLSTQVQDQAAPAQTTDRLQLSRADAARAATASGARTGLGGPTAEDLAAKDRELQETRSRLALLEKNVTDLQELLKLKSQTLADLQKGAATVPATSTVPAATPAGTGSVASSVVVTPSGPPPAAVPAPAPSTASQPPAPAPAAVAPVVATPSAAPAPSPVAAPTPAPVKAAPRPAEPGLSEWITDNLVLVAGLVILLFVLVGYFAVRRRKLSRFEDSIFVDNSVLHANSVFGTTGGQSVDTANSGFHSNFVPVAGSLPEHNEVDPVAEADVYIAYGRDAQAEEILKEALRADATRHAVRLKLLEIYAKRGDAKTFETMASELYAATGGQGEEWRQAAALGASIDPRNPLYSEPVVVDAAAPVVVVPASPEPSLPAFSSSEFRAPTLDFATTGLGMDTTSLSESAVAPTKTTIEHMRTDPMPRPPSNEATSAPSMDLDFDLGNSGVAPLKSTTPSAPSPVAPASADESLDFDTSGTKTLIDPFTASAFGSGDATARTAVNLPAFRARAESDATAARESDGFTASDIFGSSIIADTQPMYQQTPPEPSSSQSSVHSSDLRNDLDHQFDKTEPLDAFSKINLDLDQGDFPSGRTSDFSNKTDAWQAMATKLDLALAYSDIGDKDGARELLDEVVRNGDQAQADRARQLITELG